MKIDYEKSNFALHSIVANPNQTITIDANILIPPERGNVIFPLENYNNIWIRPLLIAFPQLAIHEAVLDEIVSQSLKDIAQNAICSIPPQLQLHKDSDLSPK
jgi:hypothetical protein